jgi:hypothetical protein
MVNQVHKIQDLCSKRQVQAKSINDDLQIIK